MTRAPIRLALPSLMLVLAVACGSKPEAPPAASAEQGSAGGAATEAPVTPTTGSDASGSAAPGATAPAPTPPAVAPVAQAPTPRRPQAGAPPPSAAAPEAETPPQAAAPVREVAPEPPAPPPVRMVTVPADTPLRLTLLSDVASDTSVVEDRVSARVSTDVAVDGETVIPAGAQVAGVVTYAQPSAKVKGRGAITVRFRTLTIGSRTYDVTLEPLRREARGTKAKDAGKIGIAAGAGAVVGGIIGGGRGAGIGAAVGGAGGTGVVLATKGEEVRLPSGTAISSRFESPLVVQLRPDR